MNREELLRLVVWQYAAVVAASVFSGVVAGLNGGLSALCGGLCVAVPNSLLALNMLLWVSRKDGANSAAVLVGIFVKMFVTVALFVVVAKFFPNLNWLAMIFGILAAVGSYFLLLINKH
jgi:ATP synthase protein I